MHRWRTANGDRNTRDQLSIKAHVQSGLISHSKLVYAFSRKRWRKRCPVDGLPGSLDAFHHDCACLQV
jgi:hypothetical protein